MQHAASIAILIRRCVDFPRRAAATCVLLNLQRRAMTGMLRNGFFVALIALRICPAGAEGSVDHAIKHRWILEQLALGPELHRYPLEARIGALTISMQIDKGVGTLQVLTTVLNTMQFTVVPGEGVGGRQFYNVNVEMSKPLASVKMGPPGLMETEAELSRGFTLVDKWLMLRNGERLMLSGSEVEMSLRRAEPRDAKTLADILGSQVDAEEHKLNAALEQFHLFEHPAADAVRSREEQEEEAKEEEYRFDSAAPMLEELKLLNELEALEADMHSTHASTAEVNEKSAPLLQQLESLKRNAEDAKPSTVLVTPPTGSVDVLV